MNDDQAKKCARANQLLCLAFNAGTNAEECHAALHRAVKLGTEAGLVLAFRPLDDDDDDDEEEEEEENQHETRRGAPGGFGKVGRGVDALFEIFEALDGPKKNKKKKARA